MGDDFVLIVEMFRPTDGRFSSVMKVGFWPTLSAGTLLSRSVRFLGFQVVIWVQVTSPFVSV